MELRRTAVLTGMDPRLAITPALAKVINRIATTAPRNAAAEAETRAALPLPPSIPKSVQKAIWFLLSVGYVVGRTGDDPPVYVLSSNDEDTRRFIRYLDRRGHFPPHPLEGYDAMALVACPPNQNVQVGIWEGTLQVPRVSSLI